MITPEARDILSLWGGPSVVTESVARAVAAHAEATGKNHLDAALALMKRVECGTGFAATGDRATDLATVVAELLREAP